MKPFFIIFYVLFLTQKVESGCRFEVKKNNDIYILDLSSLETVPYKDVTFHFQNMTYIIYLSICQHIRDFPINYLVKNFTSDIRLVIVKKFGKVLPFISTGLNIPPVIAATENNVSLTYTGKSFCVEFSLRKLKYSVTIIFECSVKEQIEFEKFDFTNCIFIIRWRTRLGCLVPLKSEMDCSFKHQENVFELSELRHPKFYEIKSENLRIKFNFCTSPATMGCGSDEPSLLSGCGKRGEENLVFNKTNLQSIEYILEESRLVFEFSKVLAKKRFPGIFVNLACKTDAFVPNPELFSFKRKIQIDINTYLACLNDDRCSYFYDHKKYNLPVKSNVGLHHENATFMLSPCGRLKDSNLWLGGASFAALNNGSVMSLGTRRMLQFNIQTKTVELLFIKGSFCPKTNTFAETRIKFQCSDKDFRPNLVSESNCTFEFEWKDPSVCPTYGAISEKDKCLIHDPAFGYAFDFQNETELVWNKTFRINLCSEIKYVCNNSTDASVCLYKGDKEIVIGKRSSQKLISDYGQLMFLLKGDECIPGIPSVTYINADCDYEAYNSSLIFVNEEPNCKFNFVLKTRKACLKEFKTPCSITTNAGTIDLSPLTRKSGNYLVAGKDSQFLLNVCRSLWFGRHQICREDSAACMIQNGNFKTIGQITNQVTEVHDEKIRIIYPNYFRCPEESTTKTMDTIINFVCDLDNKEPEFLGFINCTYNFLWKTNHACAKPKITEIPPYLKENIQNTTKTDNVKMYKMEKTSPMNVQVSLRTTIKPKPKFKSTTSDLKMDLDKNHNISRYASSTTTEPTKYNDEAVCANIKDLKYIETVISSCKKALRFLKISTKSGMYESSTLCTFMQSWTVNKKCVRDGLTVRQRNCNIRRPDNNQLVYVGKLLDQRHHETKKDFVINLCSSTATASQCKGDICIEKEGAWISGGSYANISEYSAATHRIFVYFHDGDSCSVERLYTSKIYLTCSSGEESWVDILWEDNCTAILEVKSPLVCFDSAGSLTSKTIGIASVSVMILIGLAIALFFFIKTKILPKFQTNPPYENLGLTYKRIKRSSSKEL